MRAGEWCPYHLAQIFAYRFHAGSSGWIYSAYYTARMTGYRVVGTSCGAVDVLVESVPLQSHADGLRRPSPPHAKMTSSVESQRRRRYGELAGRRNSCFRVKTTPS